MNKVEIDVVISPFARMFKKSSPESVIMCKRIDIFWKKLIVLFSDKCVILDNMHESVTLGVDIVLYEPV